MTSATTQAKRLVRRALDKAVHPYLVDLADRIDRVGQPAPVGDTGAGTSDESNAPSVVFHHTLHELRTMELERVRKGARTAVSVGASGRWYFDWFERHYGELDSHVGVEAFEPKPEDLPDYVTWVESTADRFEGVGDNTVDLVFAGQTTEHLWAQELADFLLESARVLHPGGQLVADSPNRLVTEHLHWSHGGHTVELSAAEFTELLRLAGFEPTRVSGDWLTRYDGRVWELEEGLDQPAALTRRIAGSSADPDDCFIWWIDAERTSRDPDEAALRKRVADVFDSHWNTRISRGMWPGPGSPGPHLGGGHTDWVSSLPIMLHSGHWVLTVRSEGSPSQDMRKVVARLLAPGNVVLEEKSPASVDDASASFEFELDQLWMAIAVQLRAVDVEHPVQLEMPVDLRCDGVE
ncbi:MAG: methyltransferase domain-containing protein [Actinomycetia bacterium]|nr:methyltransferase domain-containing protein [Actinomycetes bacterium]